MVFDLFIFETGSCCVVQLALNLLFSCLRFQNDYTLAWIMGTYHCTWVFIVLKFLHFSNS
jgi:hypothetical protein